jgi:preprotein translocase subunit SecE
MAIEVAQKSFPSKVVTFYNEVVAEMRKVTWPDRPQLQDTTVKIIIFVLFLGAIIGLVDVLLQLLLIRGIPSLFAR